MRLTVARLEGAILPTVEDEVLGFSPFTCYIPLDWEALQGWKEAVQA